MGKLMLFLVWQRYQNAAIRKSGAITVKANLNSTQRYVSAPYG